MLGRFLFRWRGVIGVIAFGVTFWLARPTFGSCWLGVPFLLAGLAVRFWASGYIGMDGRVREIGGRREEKGRSEKLEARGESAELRDSGSGEEIGGKGEEGGEGRRRIVAGPYRTLRHPLYIGNFFLVCGMLVALRPGLWLAVVVMAGFAVEYGVIVAAEERDLASGRSQRLGARSENAEVCTGGSSESIDEKRGTVNVENRGQSLGAPASDSARCSSRFPRPGEGAVPVLRQCPESFVLSRALIEWRTWVVTGAAWGMAVVRAFVSQ